MAKMPQKIRAPSAPVEIEQVLESYYEQLTHWGMVLARGDQAAAQDAVHDLCLYFALARPDLSQVENLDGYLYTSLRNIYVSSLARASREAAQSVSLTDFDSIHMALRASDPAELLQVQNNLRRICNFTVWRKDASKSASYLILLFFHGYARREVAAIACLPVAAIYNKLKTAREEIKAHLEQAGRLQIASLHAPPEPALRRSPVSSAELFGEFRHTILGARRSECLPEQSLLVHYRSSGNRPIQCALLAHIVSCEHCLSILDSYFQWPDLGSRIPPAGTDETANDEPGMEVHPMTYEEMMRTVRREAKDICGHRPKTLSIAVNGKIAAFHDVQGAQSTLSSRIERPESAEFIEVFAEQRIRLALISIAERPPIGSHVHTQRIRLDDNRWVELCLRFDGAGLESEVTYLDPVLGESFTAVDEDDTEGFAWAEPEPGGLPAVFAPLSWRTRVLQNLRDLFVSRGFALVVGLILALGIGGILPYRLARPPLDADQLLNRSVAVETSSLQGNAEHETMRIEFRAANGQVEQQGFVDLWREGTAGRSMRKLYNVQRVLLAAEWRNEDGAAGSYVAPETAHTSDADRELVSGGFWRTPLSASGYRAQDSHQLRARRIGENYELTSENAGVSQDAVASAVLVLDRGYRPISETLRLKGNGAIREVDLLRTSYELRPTHSVPDSVYSPEEIESGGSSVEGVGSAIGGRALLPQPTAMRAAVLQIAALYELNQLAADTGEPISITRTKDNRVLVSGTIADSNRRGAILSDLASLPDHQLLDFRLTAQSNLHGAGASHDRTGVRDMTVYDFARTGIPADLVLNRYFTQKGWSSDQVRVAMARFSHDALGHAQRALQHAYALERLGESFTPIELQSVPQEWQHIWAIMAAMHAAALDAELEALSTQLAAAGEPAARLPVEHNGYVSIHRPEEFTHAANLLLGQVQTMNRNIGSTFTSTVSDGRTEDSEKLFADTLQSIPLSNARQMTAFTSELVKREEAPLVSSKVQSKQ
jgi:DNA-directed RNA polymerase specialized sigma24 family protein